VDDYVETCKELGKQPCKPFRRPPDLPCLPHAPRS
jgi:hypothetical protein